MSETAGNLGSEPIFEADCRGGKLAELEQLKVELLGKKGAITAQLKALSALDPAERKAAGARINALRDEVTAAIEARRAALERAELARRLAADRIDVTQPGRGQAPGGAASGHPRAAPRGGALSQRRLLRRGRPRGRGRLAQLRGAQHPRQPSGAGDARHVLLPRRAPAAHAHLARCRSARCCATSRRCA